MRFLFGIIIGIALTLGAAVLHDNNVPSVPQTLADRPIVDWDALGAVVHQNIATARDWWDGLMGRSDGQRQP
jgi:hypothetical protein